MIAWRRGPAAALAALLVGGACGGTSACGAVRSDCTKVELAAAPARAAGPYSSLLLTAQATAGGKPVAGVPVNFWVKETGAGLQEGFSEALDTAHTDPGGVARIDRSQGFFGLVLPGRTVTGYYASVVAGAHASGVKYCAAQTPVLPLSCGSGDSCGPMPPLSQGAG